MPHPGAPALLLRVGDHERLTGLVRSVSVRAALAQRARIVLLASEGVRNAEIAERVGVSRPTVNRWRARYVEAGVDGLADEDRPGWSSRLLAAELKVNHVTITKAWKQFGVKPWKAETFKFSTDPELEAKVADVVGLYLRPPGNAVVLCVDEKSQIQALNRTQKVLPMQPGHAEQRTHDYVRHGTTTLFAALEVATGRVTGLCKNRHRHQEFLAFLRHVARAYPDQQLHLVMDNYATHKRSEVKAWLRANPRIQVHFTPTSASWPGRGLVRHHRTPSHPARRLPLCPRPDDQDPGLHRRLEQPQTPLHLDQDTDDVLAKIKRKQTSLAHH